MKLSDLFSKAPEIEIKSIAIDSRVKNEEGIFFCLEGIKYDGRNFIDEAVLNGAKVIVYEGDVIKSKEAIYIKVDDVLKVLNQTLKRFYHDPSSSLDLIGITGTNGKTTTAMILKELLSLDDDCGYIGTLGTAYHDKYYYHELTTPSYIELNRYLSEMVDNGVDDCVMEVTSIALEQRRTDSLNFKIAVFTNLTADHVEMHGTMHDYVSAKKRLFDNLDEDAYAIINLDSKYALEMIEDSHAKIITYGINTKADITASEIKIKADSTSFILNVFNNSYVVKSDLVTKANIYNLLAALGAYFAMGKDLSKIIMKLNSLKAVNGRMYRIDVGQRYNVLVDFADTPNSLRNIIDYATTITPSKNKIVTVIGSKYGKDDNKRIALGAALNEFSDLVILCEDDDRDEDVVNVLKTIAQGIKDKPYVLITSRENAIISGIDLMNDDDTLLILGKGDDNFIYRPFGKEAYSSDAIIAKNRIKERIKEEKDETF